MAIFKRLVILIFLLLLGCEQRDSDSPPLASVDAEDAVSETAANMLAADDVRQTPTIAPTPTPSPTPMPTPAFLVEGGILVSEVFVGTSRSFVELYNASDTPYDLQFHSLLYQHSAERAEVILASWDTSTLVPPRGHYLLVQENASVDVLADLTFTPLLSAESGALLLYENDQPIEQSIVAWGASPPESLTRGDVAPALSAEMSLERLPGGVIGNGVDSGDSARDFKLMTPSPQNSGSAATPPFSASIQLAIELPEAVVSGSEFGYFVRIRNLTGETLENVQVSIPFDDEFVTTIQPEGAEQRDNRLAWTIETLVSDANITEPIYVQAPFRTDTLKMSGGFVSAENVPMAFANVAELEIEGGTIPISAARAQIGQVVTVAGIATVNTGAFFNAEDGQTFYIQDTTGGVKVFVPAVSGRATAATGDQIRIVGTMRNFRGTVELVPSTAAVNVTRIGRSNEPISPTDVALTDLSEADAPLGQLVSISGVASRVEAFPHWYELALSDSADDQLIVRIDRVGGISASDLAVGERYQVFGVLDEVEGEFILKPRTQADVLVLPPAELLVSYRTPSRVDGGETVEHEITVVNHTDAPMTGVIVAAGIPTLSNAEAAGVAQNPSGNGQVAGDGKIYWGISELSGGGASQLLTFDFAYEGSGEALADVTISAETIETPIVVSNRIFVNQNVPIHVIQGSGERSPYDGQFVTTNGTVTAIFPGLNAFVVQTAFPDDDPQTSEGIFVSVTDLPALSFGDALQIKGRVEEQRGQTTLVVDEEGSIDRLPRLSDLSALEPVALDPPADPAAVAAYFEPLEGMRVAIDEQALVVAPTNADGETVFVLSKHEVTQIPESDEPLGFTIVLDDGRATLQTDDVDEPLIFRKGDTLTSMIGVLAFTNDQFKIEPYAPAAYDYGVQRTDAPLPTLAVADDTLAFATLNLSGLFDRLQPHPSSSPMPTRDVYVAKLDALADAILRMDGPAVVALQTVETLPILEDLVALDVLADFQYRPILLKGSDPLGYNNALLVREKLLPVVEAVQMPAPDGLTRRPPLVLETRLNDVPLFVVAVDLISAESGESSSLNSIQLQADWLASIVDTLLSDTPDADVMLLGHMAAAWDASAFDGLASSGLAHAFTTLPSEQPYPYTLINKHGRTLATSHVWLSEGLVDQTETVQALHVHADLPIIDINAPEAVRLTAHDPLLITIESE